MKYVSLAARLMLVSFVSMLVASVGVCEDGQPQDDGKLRIIVFGAHPDDAEYRAGGCGVKWAKLGHHVKLDGFVRGALFLLGR